MDPWMLWTIAVVVCVPLYFGLGWVMFDGWSGFFEAVGYAIKPDILSWFHGDLMEDWWNEFKLHIFLGASGFLTFGVFMLVSRWWGPGEEVVMSVMRTVGQA